MINVLIANIFESEAQTLVNTVNCVGVMGKGIALGFKERFPDMYQDYLRRCEAGTVRLGHPYLYRKLVPPWVLNFPTKDHWRSLARIEDIVEGLRYLESEYRGWGITSLAVPPLGCGEGQLEWRVVGPTLYRWLGRFDIPVELYAPFGTPLDELDGEFLAQPRYPDVSAPPSRIRPGMVAVVEVLARIEQEPHHWPIGRTTVQKVAYFATNAGLPTGLSFERGSFGPYATGLKHAMTQLANNGLIREERLGRMFAVRVGSTYEDARKAYLETIGKKEDTIERLVDLFLRIGSTRQAEIAATVHFVAQSLARDLGAEPDERQVLEQVMAWKQRRRPPLNESEISDAIRTLAGLGWLSVKPSVDLPISDAMLLEV